MDIAPDDRKLHRGLGIIHGKTPDRTKINALASKDEQEEAPKLSQKKETTPSPQHEFSGLDLGRRLLLVMTGPSCAGKRSCPWCKAAKAGFSAKATRIIDHGSAQKLAIRRLFDAQVLLRSYEEQLQSVEAENKKMFFELRAKHSALQQLQGQANMDEIVEEKEEQPQKEEQNTKVSAHDGEWPPVPYWMRADQNSREIIECIKLSLMREVQEKGERLEAITIQDLLWHLGNGFAMRWAGGPDAELVAANKKISKKIKDIQKNALLESDAIRQHSRKVELRYSELQRNAKMMKSALMEAKQQALSAKNAAAQYANFAASMQQQMQSQLMQLQRQLRAAEMQEPSGKRTGKNLAADIVQNWLHPKEAGIDGSAEGRADADPERTQDQATASSANGGTVPVNVGNTFHQFGEDGGFTAPNFSGSRSGVAGFPGFPALGFGGGSLPMSPLGPMSPSSSAGFGGGASPVRSTAGVPNFMNFDYDQETDHAPGFEEISSNIQNGQGFGSLEDFGVSGEDIEQMDNEFFEPLNSFDPDMREMCIDAVNAKVRRILSLDPSKWINGRLPFGLRPDFESDAEAALKEQVRKLLAQLAATEEERDQYKEEADALRRKIEEMRRRAGLQTEVPQKESLPPESVHVEKRSSPRRLLTAKLEEPAAAVQLPPGISKAEMEKLLAKAREEVKQEMMKEIRLLEAKLKAKEKEVEELRRRLQEALKPKPVKIEQKEDPPPIIEDDGKDDEIARLKAMLRSLQEKLDEAIANPKIVEVIKEVPSGEKPPEPVIQVVEAKGDSPAAKKSQELLHSLLVRCAAELDVKPSKTGQKAVEKVLGSVPGKKYETRDDICDKALPSLETWTAEILGSLEGVKLKLTAKPKEPEPIIIEKIVEKIIELPPPPRKETPREGKCYVSSHKDLQKRVKELEEEMAKILLTVDELRRRVEKLQQIPIDPDEDTINSIMEKVGLKELADAREGGLKLKGVFQRLWQDAAQRIQRAGMIRERVALASKVFSSSMLAVREGGDPKAYGVPDFERLNETTQATLRTMKYHSDYIFKQCCEYAILQGVEAPLAKELGDPCNQENTICDTYGIVDDEMPEADRIRHFQKTDRLPGRLGHRPHRSPCAQPVSKILTQEIANGTPSSFKNYVALLRQAQDQAFDCVPKLDKLEMQSMEDSFLTMKEACALTKVHSPSGLSASLSLPVLPKTRNLVSSGP